MTSTVALDPLDFEAAAGNFHQIQLNAVLRLGSLSRELRQYDNMAGTDSGGQAFSTEYDANAMSIVQALDYLAIRASEFDFGLTATAAAHDLAEQSAAGNVAGASSFTPRPVFAGENPSPPPSAFGGDPTPPPEPWGTVKEFIGAMWPDANIDTLNRAAATWRRIGDNLDEVAREVRRADDPLAATRSGEIAAIRTRVAELADTIALIARDADEVGASCEEYAAIVHAAHEEVFAMLRQLAIEIIAGIGIGVALSFFTFGAAGAAATGVLAARIVSVAARITQTILKVLSFAQKAAGRFAAVHGRLVAAVARLTPRSQTFIRVGNQVVAETSAAVFSEGIVRGENANYLSAFAGGFVGAGSTAGVLSIFGRRADTVLANVVGGTAGGFTGSLAATGVTGNISVENLILGTVMGTAGGTLGGGGSARSGTDAVAPTPSGNAATVPASSGGSGAKPSAGDAPPASGSGGNAGSPPTGATGSTGTSTNAGSATPTSVTPASTTPTTGVTSPGASQGDVVSSAPRPESGDGGTTGTGDSTPSDSSTSAGGSSMADSTVGDVDAPESLAPQSGDGTGTTPAGGADGAGSSPDPDGPRGPARDSDEIIREYVDANGLSNQDLHDLRHTPADQLRPEQRATLQELRELIDAPTDHTPLVKIIPIDDVPKYAYNEYSQVGGFVARATDLNPWGGLDSVVADARLDYTPRGGEVNPYTQPGASEYGFIEFQTPDAGNLEVPYSSEFGGTSDFDQPFSGSGFVLNRNDVWRPEYLAGNRMGFAEGARLWAVGPDGARLVGIYVDGIGFVGRRGS